jgi:hypothetical protein
MTTFCHYVLHFTGPATAQRWTAAHPGTFVMSLGDLAELARRHAARAFGCWSPPLVAARCWSRAWPRPEPWPGAGSG